MGKALKAIMRVKGTAVTVLTQREDDYISLTDIARHKNSERIDDLIRNWLRNRNTIEFLGVWERLNNPVFKPVEFDGIRIQAGLNSFTLTPKQWIEKTAAIGIVSRPGRYGGTFAHMKLSQGERLKRLNEIAIRQMQVLTSVPAVKKLKG